MVRVEGWRLGVGGVGEGEVMLGVGKGGEVGWSGGRWRGCGRRREEGWKGDERVSEGREREGEEEGKSRR